MAPREETTVKRFVMSVVFVGLVLSAVFSQPAKAQVLLGILFGDKLANERFHIGLNAGLNLADLSGVEGSKLKPGLLLGLVAEWRMGEHIYLQPEILPFYHAGAKNLPLDLSAAPPPFDTLVTAASLERDLKYFEVPVIVKYGVLENRLLIGAGPQIGFLLSASDVFNGVINKEITVKDDIESRLNSFDAGVAFQLEYKFKEGPFAASISGRYYLGLTDTVKDNPGDPIYNRVLSIFASIPIGGSDDDEEG
jgi:hypothetical protein